MYISDIIVINCYVQQAIATEHFT